MSPVKEDQLTGVRRIYFIGIGGVGMSAIARVLKVRGYDVMGSDRRESRETENLRKSGIDVFAPPAIEVMKKCDLVVYSTAIPSTDEELSAARNLGVKVCHRGKLLASILNFSETSIGVTGTHGKTTTASMIGYALSELRKDPTCMVGGDMLNCGSNAIAGLSGLCVAEVDESDKSHEAYALHYAVITNLEQDHVENYSDLNALENSFNTFVSNMQNPGLIVYSGEDALSKKIIRASGRPSIPVGFSQDDSFSAQNIMLSPFGAEFDLYEEGFYVRNVVLGVPGRHNIMNALMAIAVLTQVGMDLDEVCDVISGFRGTRRRLELKGRFGNVSVVDDYAHHPTEIEAVISALKSMGERVTVIFQPHRYTRTAFFYKEFAEKLALADQVIVTDIYAAGEDDNKKVHAGLVFDELIARHHSKTYFLPKSDVVQFLHSQVDLSGVVAFLGAGNIGEVADEFACRLKNFAAA